VVTDTGNEKGSNAVVLDSVGTSFVGEVPTLFTVGE
jgi:hypothetical protein